MTSPPPRSATAAAPAPASTGRSPPLAWLIGLPWSGPLGKLSATLLSLVVLAAIGLSMGRRAQANAPPPPPARSADALVEAALPARALDAPTASASAEPSAPPPAPAASGSEAAPPPSAGTLADGRVVLNLATEEDLRHLSGIGPGRARAILALRQRLGKFRQVSDLLRVKGLGRKTLARLAPRLLVDAPPTPPA